MITSNTNTEKNIISKSKPPFIILLVMFVFIGLAGCSDSTTDTDVGNGNGDDNGGTTQQGPDEVWMEGRAFNPGNLEVEVGTTVTWENKSNEVHTVTSGSNRTYDELFDSGNMSPGDTFTYTFNEVGQFDYFCRPHTGMTATVTVIDNG